MKTKEQIQQMIDSINQEMEARNLIDKIPDDVNTVDELIAYQEKLRMNIKTDEWIGKAFDKETYKIVSEALFERGDTGRMIGLVEGLMWVLEQLPSIGLEKQ